jgi:AcrR family transcriptional regulator
MAATIVRGEIRDAILDATERLLARYGYRKMTVEDIAREVGIGKGSIYLHFNSKEEVVLTHVDRIVERLKVRLREMAQEKSSAADRLREMLLTRVLFRFDSIQYYTQSLNDLLSALRPGLLSRRARYFDEEAQIFGEVLEQGRELGEFELTDPLSTAHVLLDATNSLLPYSLSTTELGEREEVQEKAMRIAEMLLNGLLKREFSRR